MDRLYEVLRVVLGVKIKSGGNMKRLFRTLLGMTVLVTTSVSVASNNSLAARESKHAVMSKVAGLGVPFIANAGQIANSEVLFQAHTFCGTVCVTRNGGIVYALPGQRKLADGSGALHGRASGSAARSGRSMPTGVLVLRERLVGGRTCLPEGVDRAESRISSFVGTGKENWRTDIPVYDAVSLGQVYAGIELRLKAYGRNVEKVFVAAPGSRPEDICMAVDGAECLDINEAGELVVCARPGEVTFRAPMAYQKISGEQRMVDVAYWTDGEQYGFDIGTYDAASDLVIDPLLASTYVGGSLDDEALSIAIDSVGNVFIAGETWSADFPVTPGAYDPIYTCREDIFVTKLNSNLSAIVASTFLGGDYNEQCYAIKLDSSNNLYVAGYMENINSSGVYVAKLNSDLNILIGAMHIRGAGDGEARALTLDASRNIYVAGNTAAANFPVTPGAYDTTYNGNVDGFVAKLAPDMSKILACTYLGGTEADVVNAIDLDAAGNIYVAGWTDSSNYPSVVGAYDRSLNGSSDVFVTKLNTNMSILLASTFVGGALDDYCSAMARDGAGNVYVTGWTRSEDFPATAGAYDPSHNGYYDVFVSKLSSGLNALAASTFLGTSGEEYGEALAIGSGGSVYVTGYTCSSNFPVTAGAYDTQHNGGAWESDVFVSKFASGLDTLQASTFIGGGDPDYAYGLVLDRTGNVYVTGLTLSSNYPVTSGAYDTTYHGHFDVFVSKLDSALSSGRAHFNDYNGDGRADLAVFDRNGGYWYIMTAAGEPVLWQEHWGWSGAVPVPGDYDGDGRYDLAVFDANTGKWYIKSLAGGVILWGFQWGWPGAEPVWGDYDDDGHDDLAMFDTSTGKWYVWSVSTGHAIVWGQAWGGGTSDTVPGDYNGDSIGDLAVFDQNTGNWYIRTVAGNTILWQQPWGWAGVIPVSGDFDGDGRGDLAVFDEATGYWYIQKVDGTVLVWQRQWGWNGCMVVGGRSN